MTTQTSIYPSPSAIWTAQLDQSPAAGPALWDDVLLLATHEAARPPQHGALQALSVTDGALYWNKALEHTLASGIVAQRSSTSVQRIIAAASAVDLLRGQGAVLALDKAGQQLWRWPLAGKVRRVSAPAVSKGAVCVSVDARTLVWLGADSGEEQGRAALDVSASLAAPLLVGDVAYVPCRGPYLLTVGSDGSLRWRFDADAPELAWLDRTRLAVGDHLYTVFSNGVVLALQVSDGSLVWQRSVGPPGKRLSALAADDERLYVGARDGVYALDLADGSHVWHFFTIRRIEAAPLGASLVSTLRARRSAPFALSGSNCSQATR